MAMLFVPFWCTNQPLTVPPFLLTLNLSPKDIDIMKLKVTRFHGVRIVLVGKTCNYRTEVHNYMLFTIELQVKATAGGENCY